MIVKLQTEHYLEFLSLKGGCQGSSDYTHVKLTHCWKSHAMAHIQSVPAYRSTGMELRFLSTQVQRYNRIKQCASFCSSFF